MNISPPKNLRFRADKVSRPPSLVTHDLLRAFTLVEIAICLGIIGFAFVVIIALLPAGLHTQRDNREATIVNQDASVIFESVRNGSRGADDLTNYIYAIVNWRSNLTTHTSVKICYTNQIAGKVGFPPGGFTADTWHFALTNGGNIIGLLSTPEYMDGSFDPTNNLLNPDNNFSNRITAYVTALSGLVSERPPQDNDILRQGTFSYRVDCVNAAVPVDTNLFNTNNFPVKSPQRLYVDNLARNQHELRMRFLWPLLPNGEVATGANSGRQTFRATIAGQLSHVITNGFDLYFYQSQFFTNAP